MSTAETSILLTAIYPYDSRAERHLSFEKGDQMYLIKEGDADWWFVKHFKTSKIGFVPKTFVTRINTLDNEKWYAGRIPRNKAEKILSNPSLPSGSYLIRQKESSPHEFVLTMRYYHQHNKDTVCGLCCQLSNPVGRTPPSKKLNWDIQRNQLQLKKQLGSGNFGEVWYGTWRGIVEVAIKTLKQCRYSVTPEVFLQEAEKLNLCNHPNILKFYGVCSREDPFYIITEYVCNGALLDYLRNEKNHPRLEVLVSIATQIANGMTCLEEIQLVHRDLAARNILLGQKLNGVPNVKIADFGLAYSLTNPEINADLVQLPTRWTAPEILNRTGISSKSDIWSFGILLYELFSKGATPYDDIRTDVKHYIQEGNRLSKPSMCPTNIYEEVNRFLKFS